MFAANFVFDVNDVAQHGEEQLFNSLNNHAINERLRGRIFNVKRHTTVLLFDANGEIWIARQQAARIIGFSTRGQYRKRTASK